MIKEIYCKSGLCIYQCKLTISLTSNFTLNLDEIKCPLGYGCKDWSYSSGADNPDGVV